MSAEAARLLKLELDEVSLADFEALGLFAVSAVQPDLHRIEEGPPLPMFHMGGQEEAPAWLPLADAEWAGAQGRPIGGTNDHSGSGLSQINEYLFDGPVVRKRQGGRERGPWRSIVELDPGSRGKDPTPSSLVVGPSGGEVRLGTARRVETNEGLEDRVEPRRTGFERVEPLPHLDSKRSAIARPALRIGVFRQVEETKDGRKQ